MDRCKCLSQIVPVPALAGTVLFAVLSKGIGSGDLFAEQTCVTAGSRTLPMAPLGKLQRLAAVPVPDRKDAGSRAGRP